MKLFEIAFLAKKMQEAYRENGVLDVHTWKNTEIEVHMSLEGFSKMFIDYKIKLWDADTKQYERFTYEDGIKFFCLISEKELNEQDKEELEWCGELEK